MSRPPFISLDGLDGTGKSTQCRLLADWLRDKGWQVVECADPGGTPVGDLLRELLLDRRQELTLASEAFLFMASRAELTDKIIRSALKSGQLVICDRFLLANVVYQGHAGGLAPSQLWEMGKIATCGLEPDLTIVLDIPVPTALQRRARNADRMESRDTAYQERVRAGFLEEAARHPERISVIDASASIESVHERICEEVLRDLATHPGP
jgi:dTMP kinase